MGDPIRCGWFSYNVLEVAYKSQLGEGTLAKRSRNASYIMIRLQATNSAGQTVSFPFMRLETAGGELVTEVEDASSLPDWMGVLRRVEPGSTETGWLVFDAPPGIYGLRLSDGVLENEQSVLVHIPAQLDSDFQP